MPRFVASAVVHLFGCYAGALLDANACSGHPLQLHQVFPLWSVAHHASLPQQLP